MMRATLHYTMQLWGEAWAGWWVLLGMNFRANVQQVVPKPLSLLPLGTSLRPQGYS